MRIGSLFSGAGGLDLAVEQVFGGDVVWHCENDPAASKVLAHRCPGIPNLGDVCGINWREVEAVDILCGGFPCTDVSAAGKHAGLHNTRSGLWSYMRDAIDTLRPSYVVIENVRGLLNADANRPMEPEADALGDGNAQPVLRAIGAVLGDLADLGAYDARWVTVSAASVGAPHRRERVFILACTRGMDAEPSAANPRVRLGRWPIRGGGLHQLTAEPLQEDTAEHRERFGATPIGGGNATDSASDGRHEGRPESVRLFGGSDAAVGGDGRVKLLPTPRTSDTNGAGVHGDGGMDLRTTVSLLPTPRSHRRGDCESERNRKDPDLEATTHYFPKGQWGKYKPAIRRWENVTRPAPVPTEPNRNGTPRLSAAFSEWLMGWPAGHVTQVPGISRNDQLRIIGNGVVPQQASAALRYLLTVGSRLECRTDSTAAADGIGEKPA